MLPRQSVFLGEQNTEEKINMNYLSPRSQLKTLDVLPSGYTFRKNGDHVLFYKSEENKMPIPEVTDCIRIDSE